MEVALEAGADDIVNEDGVITVTTSPDAFAAVADALNEKGFESLSAEVGMVPEHTPLLTLRLLQRFRSLLISLKTTMMFRTFIILLNSRMILILRNKWLARRVHIAAFCVDKECTRL